MARCKNVRGSPPRGDGGDRGDSPPCITEVARGKRKLVSRKKRTRKEREVEEALAVARAADRAESGGRGSVILIGESRTRVLLSGRVLGTKATEVTEDQPEVPAEQEQQTPPRLVLDAPRVLRRHQQPLQRDRDAEVVQLLGLRSFTTTYGRLQLVRFRLSAKFSFTSGSHFRGSQELITSTQLSKRIFTWHM
jgi:hypothetical protein